MVNIMAAKKTRSKSVAGELYNAEVKAGTTELSFNEYKHAYLAAQEAQAAAELSGPNGILEVLEVVESAIVATETALEVVKVNKAALAKTVFEEELAKGELVRKDVLARFISEVGLTKAGANTYFQNFRKSHGLVAAKAEAEEFVSA
jgi:hypothetical protein